MQLHLGWVFFLMSEMQDLISEDGWTVLDTPILAEGLGMCWVFVTCHNLAST